VAVAADAPAPATKAIMAVLGIGSTSQAGPSNRPSFPFPKGLSFDTTRNEAFEVAP